MSVNTFDTTPMPSMPAGTEIQPETASRWRTNIARVAIAAGLTAALTVTNWSACAETSDSRPIQGNVPAIDVTPTPIPSFKIGTFNVLGAFEGENSTPTIGSASQRAAIGAASLRNSNVSIVGFQELTLLQYKLYKTALPGYDSFPEQYFLTGGLSQRSIFFKRSRFRLLAGGDFMLTSYNNAGLHADTPMPWARLQDKQTDDTYLVMNEHYPAWNEDEGSDAGGAQKRERDAHISKSTAERKADGDVAFMLGDFNAANRIRNVSPLDHRQPKDIALQGDRWRLPACIITNSTEGNERIRDAADIAHMRTGRCPSPHGNAIDHVYIANSNMIRVDHTRTIAEKRASDHKLRFYKITPK